MRKIILMGCLCLGGLMFAAVGCDDPKPQTPPKGTNPPGSGGNTNTGNGSSSDYVKACKAAAEAMLRANICDEDGVDVKHNPGGVDWDTWVWDSYEDALADYRKECEKDDPNVFFGCAKPDLKAMQACFDAVDKAVGCTAVLNLEESADCKAICSGPGPGPGPGPDSNLVKICIADSIMEVREDSCTEGDDWFGYTEAQQQGLIADSKKWCETGGAEVEKWYQAYLAAVNEAFKSTCTSFDVPSFK